jgi:capsular polysaccharide export protein
MTIWIQSKGVLARKKQIELCLSQALSLFDKNKIDKAHDSFAGWGLKANTNKIKQQASGFGVPYLHLEDGFIGYIGHPAKRGHAVSLISDSQGIYYDARQPSNLESLIKEQLSESQLTRTNALIKLITNSGITKYNVYDAVVLPESLQEKLSNIAQQKILIVDQVSGDLSITGAMADESSFVAMIAQAKENHPNATLLIRTHPDTRLGKKKGVLAKLIANGELTNVEVISEHCHPHALINAVDAVYTVSSQMGFEALLLNKPVYCFGMPFYAGWGLTHDKLHCERREKISFQQLTYAALVKYCHYYNPVSQAKCEVEDVINLISLQQKGEPQYPRLYLVGFSLWKRAFMKHFCRHLADELVFTKQPPVTIADNDMLLVWGAKYPELSNCFRVEDGFIRSNGLGANLCRPSSLSIDKAGIYFDNRTPSDLEHALNDNVLTVSELKRGQALIKKINDTGVSKYNVGEHNAITINNQDKKILLVIGQVDSDASIVTGSLNIKSNEALLYAVKEKHPNCYIIYKPHPDVVSGNREGNVSLECLSQCVDEQITHLSLTSLYSHIDELHTMTSLSGFEALLNNVVVHTWGQPFYAGWGLTTDYYPPKRRYKTVTSPELVFTTLVQYPLYIDWDTGLWITPELLIDKIADGQNQDIKKQSFWNRKLLKLQYIFEIFRSAH